MSGGGGGGPQVTGYRYFFSIHMGLGRGPVDELCEIKVADRTAWAGSVTGDASIPINNPNLFGGEEKEGGIQGTLDVLMGEPSQVAPASLRRLFGYDVAESMEIGGIGAANGTYTKYTGSDGRVAYRAVLGGVTWTLNRQASYVAYPEGGETVATDKWQLYGTNGVTYRSNMDAASPELATGWARVTFTQGGYNWETGSYDTIEVSTPQPSMTVQANYIALPGFRRMLTAVFDGLVSSNNPYPKAWKFKVRRILKGWDGAVWHPELAVIEIDGIKAMNPAHIIYECLTNRDWGRGLPRTLIDDDSFLAAATTLYNEGFGVCMRWAREDSIQAFIRSVLDIIGATIYTSRSTGLQKIRLVRGGYDTNTLPHFYPDAGLLELRDSPVGSLGVAVNEVRVVYRDPRTDEDRTVSVSNIAALQANGGAVNSVKREYKGIVNDAWAIKVGQRDLRIGSVALRKFTVTLDRRARSIEPGQVFLISDPNRGIPITPVRAGSIEDGSLRGGAITITCAQDVFTLPTVPWNVAVPNTWQRPDSRPCVPEHRVIEMPYFMLARNLSRADLDYVEPDDGYIGVLSERGKSLNSGYRIAVRIGPSTPDDEPINNDYFCSI